MKAITRLFLLFIFLMPLAKADDNPPGRLSGANIDGAMKLYWETYAWPKDAQAFNVKKKTRDNKWHTLNKEPIAPQIDDRDWQNLGLNKNQAEQFQKTYQSYISSKKLEKSTKTDFVNMLSKYQGLAVGDRLSLKSDFTMALILGYGFVDSTFKDNEETTYGVFYVTNQNKEYAEPIATFKPQKNIVIKPTIEFKRSEKNLTLTWEVDENAYQQAALFGFTVVQTEGKKSKDIYETPIGYMKKENKKMIWDMFVTLEDTNKDITYTITPVTIFQSILPSSSTTYNFIEYSTIPAPPVTVEENMEDGSVKISWSLQALAPFKDRISNMYIERVEWENSVLKKNQYPVPLDGKVFLDKSTMRDGESYFYMLIIVDRKGNIWKGQDSSLWYKSIANN